MQLNISFSMKIIFRHLKPIVTYYYIIHLILEIKNSHRTHLMDYGQIIEVTLFSHKEQL